MGTCKSKCFVVYPHNQSKPLKNQSTQSRTSSKSSLQSHQTLQNIKQVFPHYNDDQPKIWRGVLSYLKKQLSKSLSNSDILSHAAVCETIDRFKKYYLTQDEKIHFIGLVHLLAQQNYNTDRESACQFVIQKVAPKFFALERFLYTKHKNYLQCFKFITGKHHQRKHYHIAKFTDLHFNLTRKQIQSVAGIVRTFCQNDGKAFALLTLYLVLGIVKCVDSNDEGLNMKDILVEYEQNLDYLMGLYKWKDGGKDLMESSRTKLKSFAPLSSSIKSFEYAFSKKIFQSYTQNLKNFIQSKVQDAREDYEPFKRLFFSKCQANNAHHIETELKFNINSKNHIKDLEVQQFVGVDSMMHYIISLVSNKEKHLSLFQISRSQFIDKFKRIEKPSKNMRAQCQSSLSTLLKHLVNEEIDNVNKVVESVLQSQSKITQQKQNQKLDLTLKDLIYGSCRFSRLEDLILTANEIIHLSFSSSDQQFSVVQIIDKLTKIEKSMNLIIKLPHSLASISLCLEQQSISSTFHSKLSQLHKSTIYSPITNLFLLSQKYCQEFFSELFFVVEEIFYNTKIDAQIHKQLRTSQDLSFFELIDDLIDFSSKYLEPFGVVMRGNLNIEEDEKLDEAQQMFNEIGQIRKLIKTEQYPLIPKHTKPLTQQVNEIRFTYSLNKSSNAQKTLSLIRTNLKPQQIQFNKHLLSIIGQIQKNKNSLQKSLSAFKKSLKFYQRDNQVWTLEFCQMLETIGQVHALQKDYNEAIKHFQESLTIRETLAMKKDPTNVIDCAKPLVLIGRVFFQQELYKKALQWYRKALNKRESIYGKISVQCAQIMQLIGIIFQSRRNHDEAIQWLFKCLQILETIHGKESIPCAEISNKLAVSNLLKTDYDKSLSYYEHSLLIRQRIYGKDTIESIPTICMIGSAYQKSTEYEHALQYYKKSLSIVERTYGKNAIECVKALNNIIVVFFHQQKYQQAIVCGMRCLEIQEYVRGKNSIDCSGTLFGLSLAYEKIQLLKQAVSECQRSYQIRLKQLGEQHELTKQAFSRIQELLNPHKSIFC